VTEEDCSQVHDAKNTGASTEEKFEIHNITAVTVTAEVYCMLHITHKSTTV